MAGATGGIGTSPVGESVGVPGSVSGVEGPSRELARIAESSSPATGAPNRAIPPARA
jgi:hypothetical protein